MRKLFLSLATAATCFTSAAIAAEQQGVVNFSSCITDSKIGKREQQNFENIRKQMSGLIENTEKELKELSAKFEDTEYLDSLSPKAEEELKVKYQTLQEDLGRYQNQFYQVLQHAQYQMAQKVSNSIAQAAEKVAKEKHLSCVINKDACFYVNPNMDLTETVISQMNKDFDAKKLSDNSEEAPQMNATDETLLNQAG